MVILEVGWGALNCACKAPPVWGAMPKLAELPRARKSDMIGAVAKAGNATVAHLCPDNRALGGTAMRRLHGPAMTALAVLMICFAVSPWLVLGVGGLFIERPPGDLVNDDILTAADRLIFLFLTLLVLQPIVAAGGLALYGAYRLVRYLRARRGPDDGVTAGGGAQ